jgi:hypothetical protein
MFSFYEFSDNFDPANVFRLSIFIYDRDYIEVGELYVADIGIRYIIARQGESNHWIVGRVVKNAAHDGKDKFDIVLNFYNSKEKIQDDDTGEFRYIEYDRFYVAENRRGYSIAIAFYHYICKIYPVSAYRGWHFHGKELWEELSRLIDIVVDVFVIGRSEVCTEGVILRKGSYGADLEQVLALFKLTTNEIKLVMRDVILPKP